MITVLIIVTFAMRQFGAKKVFGKLSFYDVPLLVSFCHFQLNDKLSISYTRFRVDKNLLNSYLTLASVDDMNTFLSRL